jgi:hypothetical protein
LVSLFSKIPKSRTRNSKDSCQERNSLNQTHSLLLGRISCSDTWQKEGNRNIGFKIAGEDVQQPEKHDFLAVEVTGKDNEAKTSFDFADTTANEAPVVYIGLGGVDRQRQVHSQTGEETVPGPDFSLVALAFSLHGGMGRAPRRGGQEQGRAAAGAPADTVAGVRRRFRSLEDQHE